MKDEIVFQSYKRSSGILQGCELKEAFMEVTELETYTWISTVIVLLFFSLVKSGVQCGIVLRLKSFSIGVR